MDYTGCEVICDGGFASAVGMDSFRALDSVSNRAPSSPRYLGSLVVMTVETGRGALEW